MMPKLLVPKKSGQLHILFNILVYADAIGLGAL